MYKIQIIITYGIYTYEKSLFTHFLGTPTSLKESYECLQSLETPLQIVHAHSPLPIALCLSLCLSLSISLTFFQFHKTAKKTWDIQT